MIGDEQWTKNEERVFFSPFSNSATSNETEHFRRACDAAIKIFEV
jgi:hypothetical protein